MSLHLQRAALRRLEGEHQGDVDGEVQLVVEHLRQYTPVYQLDHLVDPVQPPVRSSFSTRRANR
jgi:hypothetical protein